MTFVHSEAESESARRVVSKAGNDIKPVKTVFHNNNMKFRVYWPIDGWMEGEGGRGECTFFTTL